MSNQPDYAVTIPQNADAEREVVHIIFAAPERLGEAAQILKPDSFNVLLYSKIYRAALRLDDERRQIDAQNVAEVLGDDADLKSAGGIAFLASLGDGVHGKANLLDRCKQVHAAAQRRQLQKIMDRAGHDVVNPTISVQEVLQQTEAGLIAVADDDVNATRGPVHLSDVAREVAPLLDRAGSGQGVMLGSPTGFRDLDHITTGWVSGEMILLAGRPSSGKSALALEFLLRQARKGNTVAMFSLEMSRASVFLRLLCREAKVNYHRVCLGNMDSAGTRALCAAIPRITELPIWIDDRPAISSQDLRWQLRSLARRIPVKFCVVDYIQLLRAKAENRTQEVTKISLDVKATARELGDSTGGTILALAQLNRIAANETPRLHHLRESGQLEQDADAVFLLSDEKEQELGGPNPSIKLLDVAKQRNGPTGIVRLTFLPYVMGFEPTETKWSGPDPKTASAGPDR